MKYLVPLLLPGLALATTVSIVPDCAHFAPTATEAYKLSVAQAMCLLESAYPTPGMLSQSQHRFASTLTPTADVLKKGYRAVIAKPSRFSVEQFQQWNNATPLLNTSLSSEFESYKLLSSRRPPPTSWRFFDCGV